MLTRDPNSNTGTNNGGRSKSVEKENDRIKKVYSKYMSYEKWSGDNLGNQLIFEERLQAIRKLLDITHINLQDKKILEVGCAGGGEINTLLHIGAVEDNIHGIDIRSERIEDAKLAFPRAKYSIMNAMELDFPENCFDVITTFTLFTSILDHNIRIEIANEIVRVLKPRGAILYYDFRYNNPFNINVVGLRKSEINNLFPDMEMRLKLITLLPPLARRLGKMTSTLYPVLSKIPLLCSHYLGIFLK